jgi:hypothetical protein
MTLDGVLHKRLRQLAGASHEFSPARGRQGVDLPGAGDDAGPGRLPALPPAIGRPARGGNCGQQRRQTTLAWRETALGGLLVLLGILVLAGQAVDVDVGEVAWPLLVIVPGLGLLGLGLATDGRVGEVLAMVGG